MPIIKGLATCHHFSKNGLKNYESIRWNSRINKKCEHLRNIGKGRRICMLDSSATCPTDGSVCSVMINTFVDDKHHVSNT